MRRDLTCASQVSPVSSVASPVFGSNLERSNVDFVFYSSLGPTLLSFETEASGAGIAMCRLGEALLIPWHPCSNANFA